MVFLDRFKNWFKANPEIAILIFLAIIFFFLYAYLAWNSPQLFNSPDETANNFFIKLLVERGELRQLEPLNLISQNIIHPRSINVINGFLVPGSFLGLILIFGWLAKIFGLAVVPYLTPFFSGLAILFFYGLIKMVFDRRIAFLSALLLLINPAFFYYTARSLMPNALFVDLLIIGFYFLIQARGQAFWSMALAGLFFGLALLVRSSEIIWLAPILLILFLVFRQEIRWQPIMVFISTVILILLPLIYYNQLLYGHPFYTGYAQLGVDQGASIFSISRFHKIFFPFGFSLIQILRNFYHYQVQIFWWFFLPAILGLFLELKNLAQDNRRRRIFFWLTLVVFLILTGYYGSWQIYDNITKTRITIGNSFIRYWLPISVSFLPWASWFLVKLTSLFKKEYLGRSLALVAGFLIVFLSLGVTWWSSEESLGAVKKNLEDYKLRREKVLGLTEPESIIITDRADKVFFPERRVIISLTDLQTLRNLSGLIKLVPVYYDTFETEPALDNLNQNFLAPY